MPQLWRERPVVCRHPKKSFKPRRRQHVQLVSESESQPICVVYQVGDSTKDCWKADVELPLHIEVDTGARVSLVSEKTYCTLFGNAPLQRASTRQCNYSGEQPAVLGQKEVTVKHGKNSVKLPLVVVKEDSFSLLVMDG